MDVMTAFEGLSNKTDYQERLRQFAELREATHRDMKIEEETRLKDNPTPTEEELYLGVFLESLEPQVRDAVRKMFEKGYATQSSGFHGEDCAIQMIDGYFNIDNETTDVLNAMGVEVLRGADIGLPENKSIRIIRFRARNPSLDEIKGQWDAIAAVLLEKELPKGIRPISDRAEEFREECAPSHPSLDPARTAYFEYLRSTVQ
jgi:hypothetical protein